MAKEDKMLTEAQRAKFCGMIMEKFGIDISPRDEMLPMMFVSYHAAVRNSLSAKKSHQDVQNIISDFRENISSKLSNLETTQYRFDSAKEAFLFAFGGYGLPVLGIAVCLLIGFFGYMEYSDSSHRADYIELWVNNAKIHHIDREGLSFPAVELIPAESFHTAKSGKNFVYDKACDCYLVPLYFKK